MSASQSAVNIDEDGDRMFLEEGLKSQMT